MKQNFFTKLLGDVHYAMNLREHAMVSHLTPDEKRERLGAYAGRYSTFIETGTYLGETTQAMSKLYGEVHTIEVSPELHAKAAQRFAGNAAVTCHLGDSADVLPRIVGSLTKPAVFWLDGHYAGPRTGRANAYDTPIIRELEIIFQNSKKDHMILIDDARQFVGRNSYPRIGVLREYVRSHSQYFLTIRDDIIRLAYDPEWS
ncbi:MAG TPA: hypothetical protein PLS03_01120 [Terrimicrobiaceae bacterium]|nr:hypothetical protein [Terrimicrobiaceae bacterium]